MSGLGSITVDQPDMTGLNELVSGLNGALIGSGGDGDIHRVLKSEAGQLAWDISQSLGPSTKSDALGKIERDMKQFLTTKPAYSNLDSDQQYSSVADFTWLQAGPNFLVGINDEDNMPGASGGEAVAILRAGQKSTPRGKAYVSLGRRGKQHVYRLNRTRIAPSAFRAAKSLLSGKVGLLRASFAFAASVLIPAKRIPEWIAAHFPSRAQGRAVFSDAGLSHPTEPFIEFGSNAAGVESNPRISSKISGAVERRKVITRVKIQNVLKGYAYDWNTGRVFRRRESGDMN